MPAQWPGNTATKLARAATGGGFESAIDGLPQDGNFPAANLLVDDFSTGNLSTTNTDGFAWGNQLSTSLVTMSPAGNPTVVFDTDGNEIYNEVVGDPRDWTAKVGDNSMRFRYSPGTGNAEQRYHTGTSQTDLWVKFWLRVPTNYQHRNGNHKLFDISMGNYATQTPSFTKVTWEYWPADISGNSKMQFSYDYKFDEQMAGTGSVNSGPKQPVPFIDATTDKGRWMQLVFRVKASSSGRSTDGIIQAWRRWEDESSFTKQHEKLDAILEIQTEEGATGFQEGFFLGYVNDGFAENTEFLMDKVEFSTEALI